MCELFCLSSRLPTSVTFSLRKFADRGGLGSHNVDGWGVAFHDGREARLYKEPEPAGDSPWLAFIQERRLPTRLLISHIRHATRGALSLANTQPFAREPGERRTEQQYATTIGLPPLRGASARWVTPIRKWPSACCWSACRPCGMAVPFRRSLQGLPS